MVAIISFLTKFIIREAISLVKPGIKGYIGESVVGGKLNSLANSHEDYFAFHNVILGVGNGTTQIDHVLISPCGIFVIETKNMKGWIFGGEKENRGQKPGSEHRFY